MAQQITKVIPFSDEKSDKEYSNLIMSRSGRKRDLPNLKSPSFGSSSKKNEVLDESQMKDET